MIQTLSDLVFELRDRASGRSDLLSVRFGGRQESLSTTDFLRNVHSLALAFEQQGLVKGDRVAIFSENRPEWHAVDLACHLLGLVTVPLAPGSRPEQAAYILRNSGSRWVFFSDVEKRDLLDQVAPRLPLPIHGVVFDGEAAGAEQTTLTRWMGTVAEQRGQVPIERFRGRVEPADLASIVYPSRTTGDLRGVCLSHRNLVTNLLALSEVFELEASDRALTSLPLSHLAQRTVDYLCFYRAVSLHYLPSADQTRRALADVRPTLLLAPPGLYLQFYDRVQQVLLRRPSFGRGGGVRRWALDVGRRHAEASQGSIVGPWLALERQLAERWVLRPMRRRFGGRLRLALTVGRGLPAEVDAFYEAIGLPVHVVYGPTATSPLVSCSGPGRRRARSVGRPLPEVEVKTAENGEVLVRGPGLSGGQWQDSRAAKSAPGDGGWLATGELGEIDAEGFLFIAGHKEGLLLTSAGEELSPEPIEQQLAGQPGIAQAVVLGDGRPFAVALLVPDFELLRAEFGARLSDAKLAAHPGVAERLEKLVEAVNQRLARHEQVGVFDILDREFTVDDGALSPQLKPRRALVGVRFAERLEKLYALAGEASDGRRSRPLAATTLLTRPEG